MTVIKVKDLINELKEWGMDSAVRYDDAGEAWVLDVITRDGIYTLHRAFEYNGELYAKTEQLYAEQQNPTSSSINYDNSKILLNARMNWIKNHKSKEWVRDFELAG